MVFFLLSGKPVLWMTWEGTEPHLPSILLNSHTDVVAAFPQKWNYDPFGAFKDDEGNIFGRGTQDMKSVGILHLEAVRILKEKGIKLKRTIHLCFVPDEEIGGDLGMKAFVQTEDFKSLNVGLALDEGSPREGNLVEVYYDERVKCSFVVKCPGNPGHGLMFIENTGMVL